MKSYNEILSDVTKTATKIPQSDYLDTGKYRIFDQGKEYSVGFSNDEQGVVSDYPYIIFGDHTRAVKYVNEPCFIGADGVKLLKVINKDFNPRFVYYNILAKPIENQGYARHFKFLKEIQFTEKTLSVQTNIVTELDTIQSAIDNKKQQLSLLDEAVKSEFVEMFGDLDCNIKTIEQTCTMKSGTTFSKDEENDSGEIFYIKVSGMNLPENDKYIKTSLSFVSRKVAGKTIIPANSIIFPKRGGAIGTNKKRITEQEICIDLNTMAVTPSNELNIQYLYQYFQNLDMGKLYNGSTVPQINNKDIGPLKIKVPPLELQQQFAAFVQQIDKSKFVVKQQISDLQELLDYKMNKYFGD